MPKNDADARIMERKIPKILRTELTVQIVRVVEVGRGESGEPRRGEEHGNFLPELALAYVLAGRRNCGSSY
jgi:hypothetical protein